MRNNLDDKIVKELEKHQPKEVGGTGNVQWCCPCCSNPNDILYGILKINEMIARCKYCDVAYLVKPEWEE